MDEMEGLNTWWSIHGSTLLEALYRVYDGEYPDLVYAELYANSEPDEGQD